MQANYRLLKFSLLFLFFFLVFHCLSQQVKISTVVIENSPLHFEAFYSVSYYQGFIEGTCIYETFYSTSYCNKYH